MAFVWVYMPKWHLWFGGFLSCYLSGNYSPWYYRFCVAVFATALFYFSHMFGHPIYLVRYGTVKKEVRHLDAIKESVKAKMPEAYEDYMDDTWKRATTPQPELFGAIVPVHESQMVQMQHRTALYNTSVTDGDYRMGAWLATRLWSYVNRPREEKGTARQEKPEKNLLKQ
uniref:Uncharacterized protein n=1 Tax=Prymnesium polylepis TaxID=72548 RepID=A0A7S4HGF2_9EUKA